MSRRRKTEIFDILLEGLAFVFRTVPPWICIPVAAIGYFAIGLLLKNISTNPVLARSINQIAQMLGGLFVFICLLAGFKGWQFRRERKRFMEAEIDLEWVRKLSWQDFEKQVAAVYEQKGYSVEHLGGNGPDGGIDIKLRKDGKRTVVQCKHWKSSSVNVRAIRELFGVMAAERADAAIFIASGRYTIDAYDFAADKPIQLIAREEFIELVRQFQRDLRARHLPRETQTPALERPILRSPGFPAGPTIQAPVILPVSIGLAPEIPSCPKCNSAMVIRRAKKGANAGGEFWGCSEFTRTRCRGTREIAR